MEAVPNVPERGFIMFDEPGISVGHRTWLSEANQCINFVTQSFRYKFVNVIFALPSKYYLDKVPREMCHFEVVMSQRGHGSVYRILKSAFADYTFTKFICHINLKEPSKTLTNAYESARQAHMDKLYSQLTEKMKATRESAEEARKKALTSPHQEFEVLLDKTRLLLPQIIDKNRWTTHGLINMHQLKQLLGLSQTRGYEVRDAFMSKYLNDWGKLTNQEREQRIMDIQQGKEIQKKE